MNFNNTLPEWKNTGTEPSDTLKENGFVAGYKPPANIFNWFWNKVIAAITELQTNLSNAQTHLNAKAPTFHANPETTYGIGSLSNYGHVKLSDSTSTTSGAIKGIAATPTAVKAAYDLANTANNKANITKNPAVTTGDIISTHLTVGSRGSSTIGDKSFSTGYSNDVSGNNSAAIGYSNDVSGDNSAAIGNGNTASGSCSVAIGSNATTSGGGSYSVAIGANTTASGNYSVAIGYNTTATDYAVSMGSYNTALSYQLKAGHRAKEGTSGHGNTTTGDAFIIGNGINGTLSNCFRVGYDGYIYGGKTFAANSADNAHFYEWLDGNPNNEDRRGLFVTLDGTKIRLATPEDTYIKGVVSAQPSFVSNAYSDNWQGMYLKDIFGAYLKDENGNYIINPDYDTSKEYIPRENRPEWDWVTNDGDIVLVDDGTCEVNGFATVGAGGKATKSDTKTDYRVMERKDDIHIYVSVR